MALDGVAAHERPESDAAERAARYGLSVSGARPHLVEYIRRLWRHRHFITEFAKARSTTKYTRARLGQLWHVFTPLLNAAVYYLIFGLLLGTSRGVPDFIPFLVTGVFIFDFTRKSVMAGVKAISGDRGLIRALHFPRAAMPVSAVLIQLREMLVSMAVLLVIVLAMGQLPRVHWLLIVPILVVQLLFNTGLAMWAARIGSKVSDASQLLPFVLRTWMYASGVMYSIDIMAADAPRWVQVVLDVNPAAVYIDLMRFALIDSFTSAQLPPHVWALALGWALLAFIGGFIYFWRAEEEYGRD
ncbi:ABC transporter permease [Streptomonospora nanhaiensis]|uniref:Transport permease protein n=1 Tax=Streptomonospora nanhaiensis TaxID=1323731 RepID=A0A853BKL9_9ACTN|nr:ABC transporter permease [Streptomonospora nanhaiensis]NYI95254.1 teichoic acid transport system permease protein [Streptomonospora nanhaiensis]